MFGSGVRDREAGKREEWLCAVRKKKGAVYMFCQCFSLAVSVVSVSNQMLSVSESGMIEW